MAKGSIGTVVQVIGPVLDIRFKDGELPQLLNAVEVESGREKTDGRGRAAYRRRCGALYRDEQHGWPDARRESRGYRRIHHGACRRKMSGTHLQPVGVSRLITNLLRKMSNVGLFTAIRRRMTSRRPLLKSSKRASRLLT